MANKCIKEYVQHSVTARKCKWKLHEDPASPSQAALTKSQRKNKCQPARATPGVRWQLVPPLRKCTELPPETQSRPTLDQSYALFLSKLTYSRDLHTHAYCSTIHKCKKKKNVPHLNCDGYTGVCIIKIPLYCTIWLHTVYI